MSDIYGFPVSFFVLLFRQYIQDFQILHLPTLAPMDWPMDQYRQTMGQGNIQINLLQRNSSESLLAGPGLLEEDCLGKYGSSAIPVRGWCIE